MTIKNLCIRHTNTAFENPLNYLEKNRKIFGFEQEFYDRPHIYIEYRGKGLS